MAKRIYTFRFHGQVPLVEAELTLRLAVLAVGGLHGETAVLLDAPHQVHISEPVITIDATSRVGMALVRIYTAYLIREFGAQAFQVRRLPPPPETSPPEVTLEMTPEATATSVAAGAPDTFLFPGHLASLEPAGRG